MLNFDGAYLPASDVDMLYDSLRENGRAILAKAQSATCSAGGALAPLLVERSAKAATRNWETMPNRRAKRFRCQLPSNRTKTCVTCESPLRKMVALVPATS
jgi:hypothetical protein